MTTVDARVNAALTALLAGGMVERLLVAFSGGLDSTVLLCLAREFATTRGLGVGAVHVDHGLHADSAEWARRCVASAAADGIVCDVERLVGTPAAAASIEAWARDQRYRVLSDYADAQTLVLTAHHEDDQTETVLQRVLSGAGPHGLAAMRSRRQLGRGWLARPLLGVTRAELQSVAAARGLSWIDDPANRDARYLRNRIGTVLLPALERVYPGARAGLLRLATIQGEVAALVDGLCDQVLAQDGLPAHCLRVASVRASAAPLRPFLLKRWLARAGAPVPGGRQLIRMLTEVVAANDDATPRVSWGDCAVRRYAGDLYLTSAQWAPRSDAVQWQLPQPLDLPWGRLGIQLVTGTGSELDAVKLAALPLRVEFRQGGERLQLPRRGHSQALKKLFQQWQVPVWERDLLPLIYLDDRLAAVADRAVGAEFVAAPGASAAVLTWTWTIYPQAGL